MRYSQAVEMAPPGSARFHAADIARLPTTTLRLLLSPGPAAPPLSDIALAVGAEPRLLSCLDPDRAAELKRLAARPAEPGARKAAGGRLVRGLFWFLVSELAPE